ncbi:BnaCnng14960D [Brassica napus]|uniref:BnaCnng14960D protein n=1 Tax=Brassica napus TaxID=3708 RepID=A0A078IDB4_BRANA|nr:BnaCnng14960D [Brassica napus]
METPNSGSWSELPMDILRFLLEHLYDCVLFNPEEDRKEFNERAEEYTVAWFFDKVTKRSFILPFHPAFPPSRLKVNYNIAVTRSGEVLLVKSMVFKATTSDMMPKRMFHLYKTDPNPDSEDILHRENLSFEVHSLGDEALLLDSGITEPSCPDICVFHLATKKFTRFPILSYFNPKDALWFLPC